MSSFARAALALMALWVAFPAWAASVSLSVSVQRLAVDQATRATVTVIGGQPIGLPVFEPVDGLSVRYVTQSSTPVSTVDQGIVYARRFVFEVQADSVGVHALGPVTVTFPSGLTASTGDAIPISVTERPPDAQEQPLTTKSWFFDEEIWEGEVVLYRAEVRAQQPISAVSFKLPEFDGLQRVGQAEERTYSVRDPLGDITMVDATLALLASGTGDRTQPPTVARVSVRLPGGGPWGLPQTRARMVPGDQAPLTVKPLPPPPPEFNGLVGDFQLRSSFGKAEGIAVGESVEWTVEIVGTGVVDGFQLPTPTLQDARIYRDTTDTTGQLTDGRWMASKRFHLVLVPTAPGTLELPPLKVTAFSPTQGRYVTVETNLGSLKVVGEGAKVDVQTFGTDGVDAAAPAAVELVDVYTWGPSVTPPLAPLVPFGLALVVFPGLLTLGMDGRDGLKGWWSSRKVRRAVAVRGRGRLRSLPSDPAGRLATLDVALREVLADHVHTPVGQLRRDEALSALDEETAQVCRTAFDALDRTRFAGGEVPADVDARVLAAIDALEAA